MTPEEIRAVPVDQGTMGEQAIRIAVMTREQLAQAAEKLELMRRQVEALEWLVAVQAAKEGVAPPTNELQRIGDLMASFNRPPDTRECCCTPGYGPSPHCEIHGGTA